jgi:hypothetical protein
MDVAGWLLLHSRWSVRKSAKPSARLHLRLASRRCVRCVGKGDAAGSRRAEGNMPMVRSFGAAAILICSLVPCQAQFAPPPSPPYPTAPQPPTAVPFPDRPQPPPAVTPPGAPPLSPLNPGQSNAAPQLQGGLQLNCTAVGQRVYQRSGEPVLPRQSDRAVLCPCSRCRARGALRRTRRRKLHAAVQARSSGRWRRVLRERGLGGDMGVSPKRVPVPEHSTGGAAWDAGGSHPGQRNLLLGQAAAHKSSATPATMRPMPEISRVLVP